METGHAVVKIGQEDLGKRVEFLEQCGEIGFAAAAAAFGTTASAAPLTDAITFSIGRGIRYTLGDHQKPLQMGHGGG